MTYTELQERIDTAIKKKQALQSFQRFLEDISPTHKRIGYDHHYGSYEDYPMERMKKFTLQDPFNDDASTIVNYTKSIIEQIKNHVNWYLERITDTENLYLAAQREVEELEKLKTLFEKKLRAINILEGELK